MSCEPNIHAIRWWATSTQRTEWSQTATINAMAPCPDLLRYEQIGTAGTWRGRVVRAFFWLLRWWPT